MSLTKAIEAIRDELADLDLDIEGLQREIAVLEGRKRAVLDAAVPLINLAGADLLALAGVRPLVIEATSSDVAPPPPPPIPLAKKTAPAKAAARKGRPRKYDHDRVAEVAIAAYNDGRPIYPAVAAEFNVSVTSASNIIRAARRSGHEIPFGDTGARSTPPPPIEQVHLGHGEITQAVSHYLDALRLGKRPIQYVADQLDRTKPQAQSIINMAREQGLLPPADQPQLPADERAEDLAKAPSFVSNSRPSFSA